MYYKLIRESQDGKAVRGHIYSVEHRFSRSVSIYKEYLTPLAPTLENAEFLVPPLTYKIAVTMSPRFGRLLPVLQQVPNRSGIRFIGVPENFNFWGERRTRETYRCDEVASQSEGFERDKGCILVSRADEQSLTARFLAEQTAREETRLEIVNNF